MDADAEAAAAECFRPEDAVAAAVTAVDDDDVRIIVRAAGEFMPYPPAGTRPVLGDRKLLVPGSLFTYAPKEPEPPTRGDESFTRPKATEGDGTKQPPPPPPE